MHKKPRLHGMELLLKGMPVLFLVALLALFGSLSPRFLDLANLLAILAQASWLIIAALGVNFTLLGSGVDLSIGGIVYLVAVALGIAMPSAPIALLIPAALLMGAVAGALNAGLILRLRIPSFVATLALAFLLRGMGLFWSDTQMVAAAPHVAAFGRAAPFRIPAVTLLGIAGFLLCSVLLRRTLFGIYLRATGADRDAAWRTGIPVGATIVAAYMLSGAFAGLAGFISFAQTSAATGAFGVNAEFLAIAAAVLGGTSLFGGRGGVFAPVLGGLLITAVQNGLVLVDANPYAYPVTTGAVIFIAAFLDSARRKLLATTERPHILVERDVEPAVATEATA